MSTDDENSFSIWIGPYFSVSFSVNWGQKNHLQDKKNIALSLEISFLQSVGPKESIALVFMAEIHAIQQHHSPFYGF